VSGRRGSARERAREAVWERLEREGAARFPTPVAGRIPNFAGARRAAERLLDEPPFAGARCLKVNPDAPQRPVRLLALRRGIRVLLPTPRLRDGFWCLDPDQIAESDRPRAASLSHAPRFARRVPLGRLPRLDGIVCGSVAVTRSGRRCGKGHGYADLEYAILRELGHPPVPVATTIHPLQWVPRLQRAPHDLPVAVVATPEEVMRVRRPPPAPQGIDWSRLDAEALEAMPVLRDLRRRLRARSPRRAGRR